MEKSKKKGKQEKGKDKLPKKEEPLCIEQYRMELSDLFSEFNQYEKKQIIGLFETCEFETEMVQYLLRKYDKKRIMALLELLEKRRVKDS